MWLFKSKKKKVFPTLRLDYNFKRSSWLLTVRTCLQFMPLENKRVTRGQYFLFTISSANNFKSCRSYFGPLNALESFRPLIISKALPPKMANLFYGQNKANAKHLIKSFGSFFWNTWLHIWFCNRLLFWKLFFIFFEGLAVCLLPDFLLVK